MKEDVLSKSLGRINQSSGKKTRRFEAKRIKCFRERVVGTW